ncbi:N-acetyltransferase [Terribacillus saccharophilus]|uniref:GNAT family N-acetyltransferase n=1 Tax=Terribacillus saccharophilus TaxID=361277 RepID=UPI003981B53A
MTISAMSVNHPAEDLAKLIIEGFGKKFHALRLSVEEQKRVLLCLAEHILQNHYDDLLIMGEKSIDGVLFIKPRNWKMGNLPKRLYSKLRLASFVKTMLFLYSLDHSCSKKEIHIDFIAVSESCRGQGIGSKLIERVKQQAEADQYISLFVSANNTAARRLYEKQQFRIMKKGTSIVGRYFHGIESWYFMVWRGAWENEEKI